MPNPHNKVPGLPARRAALKLLDAVLRRGETLEQTEHSAMQGVQGPADRALARAIAGETLRWLTDLDALIDSATKKRLPDDAKPRTLLRLMLAQALRLDTPAHAVIATGLDLLAGGPRRLAHGVFSTLMKREARLPDVPTLPDAVRLRWGERAEAIAPGLIHPPEVDLALKHTAETEERCNAMGGVSLTPGHIRLPRGTPIDMLPSYADGAWWVQDLAAQIPPRLLGAGDGKRALDLCAAPGGKSLALAAQGWQVTALDISEKRLDMLRDNLKRTGLEAEIVKADAMTYTPAKRFDAILLDAPCTATGTCRRHPDVLHRVGPRQIGELTEIQHSLIMKAVEWMSEGTVLVYAVCSLEAEEGEEQAAWIDATFDLEPMPIASSELAQGIEPTPEGWLRTHPGMLADDGGLDGFFVARWRKR
ncbi:RsmB/NOP family class I SAM-dependent RNA methyltransferase [Erythrobacter sp. JK5]|uniref:RsmB/NOP family class I SAM-dependent RNA methyltransferase n=1 Tax=Erythrobacter sp. JK5 TaxID=2829500 RepID=UPI001BA57D8F|nr:RsmB/NOP family class I SAM-dependent RNA methyltransferase [Erythrobacter sp. JK5]QUL36849.1 RsmB/NOP family class I SAM-dependent RNA methyltransferase [Erythrobacter sp. JK5]